MAFTGDAVLIRGCGRTDFQEGMNMPLAMKLKLKLSTLFCVSFLAHHVTRWVIVITHRQFVRLISTMPFFSLKNSK